MERMGRLDDGCQADQAKIVMNAELRVIWLAIARRSHRKSEQGNRQRQPPSGRRERPIVKVDGICPQDLEGRRRLHRSNWGGADRSGGVRRKKTEQEKKKIGWSRW